MANELVVPTSYVEALRLAADAEERRLHAEAQLALVAPAAAVAEETFNLGRMDTIAKFCRRLHGLNTNQTERDLMRLGYLGDFGPNGTYAVKHTYRDVLFAEKVNEAHPNYERAIYVLPEGAKLLTRLYREGKLTMKRGFERQPVEVVRSLAA